MAWTGKKTHWDLTSSTHLFTENHQMEALNTHEGKDAAHPIDPKFFLTFQEALIFVVQLHSQSRNYLTSYKNPLTHPPLPRNQSCKKSQAWTRSLEETRASHKEMQWEPKVALWKATVIAVGQHLKMWVIIKMSFVFFLWSKQESDGQQNISFCRGNMQRCWKNPQHWLSGIQSIPQLSGEI